MLVLPVDRVHSMLKSEVLQNNNLDRDVTRYLMAILEYISMEILKVRGKHIFKWKGMAELYDVENLMKTSFFVCFFSWLSITSSKFLMSTLPAKTSRLR